MVLLEWQCTFRNIKNTGTCCSGSEKGLLSDTRFPSIPGVYGSNGWSSCCFSCQFKVSDTGLGTREGYRQFVETWVNLSNLDDAVPVAKFSRAM